MCPLASNKRARAPLTVLHRNGSATRTKARTPAPCFSSSFMYDAAAQLAPTAAQHLCEAFACVSPRHAAVTSISLFFVTAVLGCASLPSAWRQWRQCCRCSTAPAATAFVKGCHRPLEHVTYQSVGPIHVSMGMRTHMSACRCEWPVVAVQEGQWRRQRLNSCGPLRPSSRLQCIFTQKSNNCGGPSTTGLPPVICRYVESARGATAAHGLH